MLTPEDQSFLQQIVLAYLAGVGTSFTPCVYPLIPITVALLGAQPSKSVSRGLFLSCCFVAGLCVTFTILGIVASLTGRVFGGFLGNPIVAFLIAGFLFVLALYNLGILNLTVFARLQNWASKLGGSGARGAFVAGLACGPVAAPCVGPVLVPILALVAQKGSLLQGSALLFSYAIGVGTLFVFVGTFSSGLSKLPRSGSWLQAVKALITLLIFVVAIDFIAPHLSEYLKAVISQPEVGFILLALALALGALSIKTASQPLLAVSLFIFAIPAWNTYRNGWSNTEPTLPTASEQLASEVVWIEDFDDALMISQQQSKPLLVDFWAEWCAACHELEEKTFVDPDVKSYLSRFVLVRVDFTESTPKTDELTERYGVIGLPWVFVTNPQGEMIEGSLVTGFVEPEEFLERLKLVEGSAFLDHDAR